MRSVPADAPSHLIESLGMAERSAIPVSLVRIRTRDGFFLDGIMSEPKRKGRTALVFVPGLGSVFYSGHALINELAGAANRQGIGYFKFNTRGHDAVARGNGRKRGGAAFERFRDCVHDIRAMVAFAKKCGYRDIILAGHSTGANKILYYAAKVRDRRVRGIMLLGPISDVAAMAHDIGWRELQRRVRIAKNIARRDPDAFVPREWGIWSASRYLSLYRPGEAEDTFPYYRARARWSALRAVRNPLAIIVGSSDEHLDRPARELIHAFRKNATMASSCIGIIIPRAGHGFQRHEHELARATVRWIQKRK